MRHTGKHIIDPETGLCEICDQDALQEVHQGKRPGKQVFYSNHDEMPHEKDRYVYDMIDEPAPRYVHKSVYPAPTVRPRRVIYEQPIEEPMVVRRKVIRRDRTPPEDVIVHRPPPHPKTFYYVDREGQMIPRNSTPPQEPPRRYIVQSKKSPPPPPTTRTVRVIRRQAQTPPPPASEVWHTGPRRQINSDTEIIERQHRMRRDDTYHPPTSPIKPEMYYIDAIPTHNRHSPSESSMQIPHETRSPPPKPIYQGDRNRKQNRVEPMERKIRNQPEPTVVRRVYKKLPPGKYQPPNDENPLRPPIRQTERNLPPPKHSRLSPPMKNQTNRSPDPNKNPSIYYIRSVDDYA